MSALENIKGVGPEVKAAKDRVVAEIVERAVAKEIKFQRSRFQTVPERTRGKRARKRRGRQP